MRDPEIDRLFQEVFDAHDDAVRALKAANEGLADALRGHDEAIDAALKATRGAITLFNRVTSNPEN